MDKTIRNKNGQFVSGVRKDLTGKRFGKLIVIGLDRLEKKRSYWLCKCDCGNEKVLRGDTLEVVRSCGCLKKEQDITNLHIKNNHEMTYHPVYSIWHAMVSRCNNPNDFAYKDYGGRGISVCSDWTDIRNFARWADETGFQKGNGLSIERVDVNGNYCPENCVWIPRSEQAKNRRNTIKLTFDGITKPMSVWAKENGVSYKLVYRRFRDGYTKAEDLFYDGNLQKRDFALSEVFGG